jgi:hypothetical protein
MAPFAAQARLNKAIAVKLAKKQTRTQIVINRQSC